jgi:K+-transporting ATPase ATPase C chain
MLANLRRAAIAAAMFFLLLGLAYPLTETAIGQAFFSHQASGSLTRDGSVLIGQSWTSPRWFIGRPDSDNPMATGGANLGPRSKTLVKDAAAQVTRLRAECITPTPGLVTTSGSGVDPDISPADAYAQVNTVARARGLSAERVRQLVTAHIEGPQLGFLGAPHVNVLQLNEALARL